MPVLSRLLDAGRRQIAEREPDDRLAETIHRTGLSWSELGQISLAQPKPSPRQLHATARPAQSLEPILFPKLRI